MIAAELYCAVVANSTSPSRLSTGAVFFRVTGRRVYSLEWRHVDRLNLPFKTAINNVREFDCDASGDISSGV